MAFKRCPVCGAYLDPGERCDCSEEGRRLPPAYPRAMRTQWKGRGAGARRQPAPTSKSVVSV